MKTKYLLIALFFLVAVVSGDILVRLFYCTNTYLYFDSQQFNNIASPLISFCGFIGLIITVRITLNQFKHQQSSSYFDYYRNVITKILQEENINTGNTIELLKFVFYSDDKYAELKHFPSYVKDLQAFKNGENVNSAGKDYDAILGPVRLFRTQLNILLKRYELLILELKNHKELSSSHKDLLFKELFKNQITDYTVGIKLIESQPELMEIKENLFIAFINYSKEMLPFYNDDFYDLKKLVESDPTFEKYLSGNTF